MGCYCDSVPPELYCAKERIARKEHVCSECKRKIQPGMRYRNISGLWEGQFDVFKMCSGCSSVWDALAELGYCLEHGGLSEHYQEYLNGNNRKGYASQILKSTAM